MMRCQRNGFRRVSGLLALCLLLNTTGCVSIPAGTIKQKSQGSSSPTTEIRIQNPRIEAAYDEAASVLEVRSSGDLVEEISTRTWKIDKEGKKRLRVGILPGVNAANVNEQMSLRWQFALATAMNLIHGASYGLSAVLGQIDGLVRPWEDSFRNPFAIFIPIGFYKDVRWTRNVDERDVNTVTNVISSGPLANTRLTYKLSPSNLRGFLVTDSNGVAKVGIPRPFPSTAPSEIRLTGDGPVMAEIAAQVH